MTGERLTNHGTLGKETACFASVARWRSDGADEVSVIGSETDPVELANPVHVGNQIRT